MEMARENVRSHQWVPDFSNQLGQAKTLVFKANSCLNAAYTNTQDTGQPDLCKHWKRRWYGPNIRTLMNFVPLF